jgi:catechol 2,3-dioxygenase-like lactoylglutathione lyase family enzyme
MKLTPVLAVDEIEKSLPFWVDRLGFAKTVEVPEGSRLVFAILVKDGAEVMLQTWESVKKDAPSLVPQTPATPAYLFIEVDDFADILKRVEGSEIALPERTTFYGMREIVVREPGGHLVCFAARVG